MAIRNPFGAAAVRAAAFLAALGCVAVPALADPIEDAIAARRGYFTLIGANFGPLVGMARGDAEYDAETAQLHVENLVALGSMHVGFLFPEGSDNASRPGETRALPAIWENVEDVMARAQAFEDAVSQLAAAPGTLDGLRGAIGGVGETCQGCHEDYRARSF